MSQMVDQIAEGQVPVQANGRPLTLAECQVIIHHLQQVNEKQAHEVRLSSVSSWQPSSC